MLGSHALRVQHELRLVTAPRRQVVTYAYRLGLA